MSDSRSPYHPSAEFGGGSKGAFAQTVQGGGGGSANQQQKRELSPQEKEQLRRNKLANDFN